MKPAAISLKVAFLPLVFMLAVLPGPAAAGDAKSKDSDQVNTAASYLLDGKSFKGPTGEKGKKTHHEAVPIYQSY